MGLLASLKKFLGMGTVPVQTPRRVPPPAEPEPEPEVPEVTVSELLEEIASGNPLLLLDCRESFERRQAHIAGDIHIPMNEIPQRLPDLIEASQNQQRPVVVYCASGMRSYGVAHFLNEQGFHARSLDGGIAGWQSAKGPVIRDH